MAEWEHLSKLTDGVAAWNEWRRSATANRTLRPDLSGADLAGMNLRGYDLSSTMLNYANLQGADLTSSFCVFSELVGTNLRNAVLSSAILQSAHFIECDLRGATLTDANLMAATFVQCRFGGANLSGCRIYGAAVWDVELSEAQQFDLIVTPADQPIVTVDSFEVGQFIYLMLNNERLRHVIDSMTAKVVLVLGSFAPRRKVVLDSIRDQLRKMDYLPVLIDFEAPTSRDLAETVGIIAHLARFVVADITDARSVSQELSRIVPGLPSVPVQPIVSDTTEVYALFQHLQRFPWVLPTLEYEDGQPVTPELLRHVAAVAERSVRTVSP